MITIGSDPELFIWDYKEEKVVSSIGLIPGIKGDAYLPPGFEEGYGLQIDNVLAEFNIPPTTTKEGFISSMNRMKKYIDSFVKSTNPNYGIKCSASEFVPWEELNSDEARLFGCSPDFNVWTGETNPKPLGEETNLRSTGFHVHVGYNNRSLKKSLELVKHLDIFLGIPSVILDRDVRRRELYGKSGCFRLTRFGVEYRTLSGVFLKDDNYLEFVWDQMQKAIECWSTGPTLLELLDGDTVQNIINNALVDNALEICEKFKIYK